MNKNNIILLILLIHTYTEYCHNIIIIIIKYDYNISTVIIIINITNYIHLELFFTHLEGLKSLQPTPLN